MNKVKSFCDLVLTQGQLHGYRGSLFTKASLIAHISVGVTTKSDALQKCRIHLQTSLFMVAD